MRIASENVKNEPDEENDFKQKTIYKLASDHPNDSSLKCPYESLLCDDKSPLKEVLSDIMIFEEESDENYKIFLMMVKCSAMKARKIKIRKK